MRIILLIFAILFISSKKAPAQFHARKQKKHNKKSLGRKRAYK